MRGSLGRRIVLGVVGIAGVTVAIASCGTWFATRAFLIGGIDRDLGTWCERMQRPDPEGRGPRRAWPPRPPGPPPGATPPRDRDRGDGRLLFQTVEAAPGRRVVHASSSLPEGVDLASDLGDGFTGSSIRERQLDDGRTLRLATVAVVHENREGQRMPQLVSMAVDLENVRDELDRLAWILAVLAAVATAMSLLAALALRSALIRPVRLLGEAIGGIGPDDLAARLPADAGPAELGGVVARLNDLLGRVEGAFRREQATIASVAHELRNPVAALRSSLEFRLPAAGEAERPVLEACLGTVLRMQTMVANLLLLARVEAGSERLQREPVDLAALAVEVAEEWEGRAATRELAVAVAECPPLPLETSRFHLRCILDNLLGNAVAHGASGGTIAVGVAAAADGIRISVVNPVTAAVNLSRLGEPFQRGDQARSAPGHCGLGLALCRRLCGLVGGSLELACDDARFTAIIHLPAGTAGQMTPR